MTPPNPTCRFFDYECMFKRYYEANKGPNPQIKTAYHRAYVPRGIAWDKINRNCTATETSGKKGWALSTFTCDDATQGTTYSKKLVHINDKKYKITAWDLKNIWGTKYFGFSLYENNDRLVAVVYKRSFDYFPTSKSYSDNDLNLLRSAVHAVSGKSVPIRNYLYRYIGPDPGRGCYPPRPGLPLETFHYSDKIRITNQFEVSVPFDVDSIWNDGCNGTDFGFKADPLLMNFRELSTGEVLIDVDLQSGFDHEYKFNRKTKELFVDGGVKEDEKRAHMVKWVSADVYYMNKKRLPVVRNKDDDDIELNNQEFKSCAMDHSLGHLKSDDERNIVKEFFKAVEKVWTAPANTDRTPKI